MNLNIGFITLIRTLLRQLDSTKILGAEKKRSIVLKKIEPNDKIILFSTLDIRYNKRKLVSLLTQW